MARAVLTLRTSATACLKTCAKVCAVALGQTALAFDQNVSLTDQGGFQPREAHVAPVAIQHGTGKTETVGIALHRGLFDRRTTRLRQPQHAGGLVKRLARRIVDGSAETLKFVRSFDDQQLAMTARDQKHKVRKGNVVGQSWRQAMTGQVIDANQGLSGTSGDASCAHHTGNDTADQTGPGCHGNRVNLAEADPGLRQGRFHRDVQLFGMGAGGDFRNHAAEGFVKRVLVGHD